MIWRSRRIAGSFASSMVGFSDKDLFCPIVKGVKVLEGLTIGLSAALIESLTVLNLPSFTDEIEYITTKKAKSSVMKSA
jgi:hypothetical protein